MEVYFSKTSIGRSHVRDGKVCQDFSACYHDELCTVLTVCDGHGGTLYIRSDRGAQFASEAAISALKRNVFAISNGDVGKTDKIKLEILCEWNRLVERDFAQNPFSQSELKVLSDEQKFELKDNYVLAYGSTLNALCVTENYCCFVNIGDGGMFLFDDQGGLTSVFEGDEENVANITCSLCSDNTYRHLNIKLTERLPFCGMLLCTDGVTGAYQSYENFSKSFVSPMLCKLTDSRDGVEQITNFIEELGRRGIGDDVSLAVYYSASNNTGNDSYDE